jgi:prepilin peptidase CpaA
MLLSPEVARWTIAGLFALVLVVAAASDIRDRRIPNWTVLAIVVLFAGWASVVGSVLLASSLEAAGIAFAVSFALYFFKVLGAGDSKLATAVALFVGMGNLLQFALITSLAGGALAVVSLAADPTRALVMFQMRGEGDYGRGVPYGVAIAAAGVLTVFGALLGWPESAFLPIR